MTNPEQKGRVLRNSEQAKLERQAVEQSQTPPVDHDEKLGELGQHAETAHEEKPAPKAEEKLELPKGALIALRKSGGLKFSSREIVVYPDGRVTYGGGDTAKTALESRATRKLMDAQIMKMRRMLEQSDFFRMTSPPGEHGGDAFAYEIVARVGSKHNQLEVFTGAIPNSLIPLIEQMDKLIPSEE